MLGLLQQVNYSRLGGKLLNWDGTQNLEHYIDANQIGMSLMIIKDQISKRELTKYKVWS